MDIKRREASRGSFHLINSRRSDRYLIGGGALILVALGVLTSQVTHTYSASGTILDAAASTVSAESVNLTVLTHEKVARELELGRLVRLAHQDESGWCSFEATVRFPPSPSLPNAGSEVGQSAVFFRTNELSGLGHCSLPARVRLEYKQSFLQILADGLLRR